MRRWGWESHHMACKRWFFTGMFSVFLRAIKFVIYNLYFLILSTGKGEKEVQTPSTHITRCVANIFIVGEIIICEMSNLSHCLSHTCLSNQWGKKYFGKRKICKGLSKLIMCWYSWSDYKLIFLELARPFCWF